jgi:LysR family transcriptional regulator, transcriptional activator of nhaA
MQWLNYQHLLYFWAVARRGSVIAAANELRLAAPTLSAQIRKLEESLGHKLLRRSGHRLVLTDAGVRIMPYAEEIFSLGQQVTELFQGTTHRTPLRLAVGTVDVLPRWLAYRLLEPALRQPQQFQVTFRKDRPERLMADLAAHELDIVFSDVPVIAAMRAQFFTQLLGESGTSFYAVPQIAGSYLRNFPRCLEGAPVLLPGEQFSIGRALDLWFESKKIRPRVVGRFDDFAMARVFAEAAEGILAAPSVIEPELESRYEMKRIGRVSSVRTQYYAISLQRKIQHPGIAAICEVGRPALFAPPHPTGTHRMSASA